METSSIRPTSLDSFVGNKAAVDLIKERIDISKKLDKRFPSLLITGPSGNGKTLLSELVAKALGAHFLYINAVAIPTPLAFREVLRESVQHGKGLTLVDEVHELPSKVKTGLLSLLEHPATLTTPGFLNPDTGEISKKDGHYTREYLPQNLSFIFATTDIAGLNDTFVNRLLEIRLFPYNYDERKTIAIEALARVDIAIEDNAADDIANRTADARSISKLCEWLADRCEVDGKDIVTKDEVESAFNKLNIDKNGCSEIDRQLMKYLNTVGQASLESLAAFLHIPKKDVSNRLEPYLIRKRFLYINQGGRQLSNLGREAIGVSEKQAQVNGATPLKAR